MKKIITKFVNVLMGIILVGIIFHYSKECKTNDTEKEIPVENWMIDSSDWGNNNLKRNG